MMLHYVTDNNEGVTKMNYTNIKTEALQEPVWCLAKTISELTDRNEHTEAVITLASALNAYHYIRELVDIDTAHKAIGHMIPCLDNRRTEIRNDLLEIIGRQITSAQTKVINSAF